MLSLEFVDLAERNLRARSWRRREENTPLNKQMVSIDEGVLTLKTYAWYQEERNTKEDDKAHGLCKQVVFVKVSHVKETALEGGRKGLN